MHTQGHNDAPAAEDDERSRGKRKIESERKKEKEMREEPSFSSRVETVSAVNQQHFVQTVESTAGLH